MNSCWPALLLVLSSYVGTAYGESLPANTKNLTEAAWALDPHLDWQKYALHYLKINKPQAYASAMHSPQAVQAEVEQMIAEFKKSADKYDRTQLYSLEVEGQIVAIDGDKVTLNTPIQSGIFNIETGNGGSESFLPAAYTLLFANPNELMTFSVREGVLPEMQRSFSASERAPAYLVLDLQILRFQQHDHAQTVIRKVRWYADSERSQLLTESDELRAAEELVKNRLLAEGPTFVQIPDHSLSFDGERILEEIVEADATLGTCRDKPRERGHRVLECTRGPQPGTGLWPGAVHRFVGGRRVQVDLYSQGGKLDVDVGEVVRGYEVEYNQQLKRQLAEQTWQTGCCEFRLNLAALAQGDRKKPYFSVRAVAYSELLAGKPGMDVVP